MRLRFWLGAKPRSPPQGYVSDVDTIDKNPQTNEAMARFLVCLSNARFLCWGAPSFLGAHSWLIVAEELAGLVVRAVPPHLLSPSSRAHV